MTSEERASIRMVTLARLHAESAAGLAEETERVEATPGGTDRIRVEVATELEAMRAAVEAIRVLAESARAKP